MSLLIRERKNVIYLVRGRLFQEDPYIEKKDRCDYSGDEQCEGVTHFHEIRRSEGASEGSYVTEALQYAQPVIRSHSRYFGILSSYVFHTGLLDSYRNAR